MLKKRIIFALLYSDGYFHLSRNFRLQKVGNLDWLIHNFGFGETCHFIDELMCILVKENPSKEDKISFLIPGSSSGHASCMLSNSSLMSCFSFSTVSFIF